MRGGRITWPGARREVCLTLPRPGKAFKELAADIRFPELQVQRLRIAASHERLAGLAEVMQRQSPLEHGEQGLPYTPAENPMSMARRHVKEAEGKVARQEVLVARLSGQPRRTALAAEAREVLDTLKHSRQLARDHLALELRK